MNEKSIEGNHFHTIIANNKLRISSASPNEFYFKDPFSLFQVEFVFDKLGSHWGVVSVMVCEIVILVMLKYLLDIVCYYNLALFIQKSREYLENLQ